MEAFQDQASVATSSMSIDAAAIVHKFLRQNADQNTQQVVQKLTDLINVVVIFSQDEVFSSILEDFGWDFDVNKFEEEDVDLAGLRIALSEKSRCFFIASNTQKPGQMNRSATGSVGGRVQLMRRISTTLKTDSSTNCFVPQMLLDHITGRIISGRQHRLKPHSRFFPGVCLLVDISGFTKLSGSFCSQGKDGIDGLRQVTNDFMGKLVEVIYAYNGDIIKFAGDAIICIFSDTVSCRAAQTSQAVSKVYNNFDSRASDTKPNYTKPPMEEVDPSLVLRAVECAVELRDVSTAGLTVHVAISCGEICFGVLGGHNDRWECLVSGACIFELSQCLDDAPSKQAVCTAKCVEVLKQPFLANSGAMASLSSKHHSTYLSKIEVEKLNSGNFKILRMADVVETLDEIEQHLETVKAQQQQQQQQQQLLDSSLNQPSKPIEVEQDFERLKRMGMEIPIVHDVDGDIDATADLMTASFDATADKGFVQRRAELYADAGFLSLVSQLIPEPVQAGLSNNTGLSYLGEIRDVTTMFMKWDAYDLEVNRDLLSLQRCFKSAQEVLASTGAFVRQFLVDDKGCVLIACWGVPSFNHMDNAHRALSATVQIRDKLRALGMPCSFGVTTGGVYCGTVGSKLRLEYAAIGSCVNMAARLMSKAKGGIFLDEETYSRLPATVLYTLEAKDPIILKGRSEPMQYYSYVFDGSVDLNSTVAEDYEVRDECKVAFMKLLQGIQKRMGEQVPEDTTIGDVSGSAHDNSNTNSSGFGLMNMITRNSTSQQQHSGVQCVVLEGRIGCGKSSVTRWLHRRAVDSTLPVVEYRVGAHDALINFSLWAGLLRLLVPKETFRNRNSLRRMMHTILNEIYPNDPDSAENVAFPAIQSALDIRCTYNLKSTRLSKERDDGMEKSLMSTYSDESNGILSYVAPCRKLPPRIVHEEVMKLFIFLLNMQPQLIVVEAIHFVDEESLKVLLMLMKTSAVVRSAIVLTAVSSEDMSKEKKANNPQSFVTPSGKMKLQPMGGARKGFQLMWYERYREQIVQHDNVKLLTLSFFSPSEIEVILRVTLKTSVVREGLPELVHQISGGSLMWVQEIVTFLTEHGVDALMGAVAPNNLTPETTEASIQLSSVSTTRLFASRSSAIVHNEHKQPRHGSLKASQAPSISQLTAHVNGMPKFSSRAATNPNLESKLISHSTGFSVSVTGTVSSKPTGTSSIPQASEGSNAPQLELLILCRFDKLSMQEQQILRTATLVGEMFSKHTLLGVLPSRLKPQMHSCLEELNRQKWIRAAEEDPSMYVFVHQLTHQIIYNLTPQSDRSVIHRTIASYTERMGEDDPEQFLLIAQHFSHFDAIKTFEYAVKAARHLLMLDAPEYDNGIAIMTIALAYVSYATDFDVLMAILNEVKRRLQSMKESGKEGDSDKIDEERKSAPTSSSTRPAAAAQLSIKIPGVGSAGGGDTVGVDCSICLGWRLPTIGWNRVTPHSQSRADDDASKSPRTPHGAVRRSRSREKNREASVFSYSVGAKDYVELMINMFEKEIQALKIDFMSKLEKEDSESTQISGNEKKITSVDEGNRNDESDEGEEEKAEGTTVALVPNEIPDWQRDILDGFVFEDNDEEDDDDDDEVGAPFIGKRNSFGTLY